MDLQTLANIGEFVGGFAFLVSLIFLIFNVRQNTAQQRENLKEIKRVELRETYERHDRFRRAILEPGIAELWLAGLSGEGLPEPADRLRFNNLATMTTYASEHTWECAQRGVIPPDEWKRNGHLR